MVFFNTKQDFIEKKLDEFQPDWRKGGHVAIETKKRIQQFVKTKSSEIWSDTDCCGFTIQAINNHITILRKKNNIPRSAQK